EKVDVPASRLKANIVKVLRDEGFVKSFRLVREEGRAWIKIQLRYDDKGDAVVRGIRRVSRPGLRRYVGFEDVARVRSGAGVAIVSTSKGILTGEKAKAARVGGEYLCEVW
ncbi:MAG TPA: 30S ribosomal protein S8, partial [Oligoflexia bacterium]|nr:30S ribosomal protein S8 [Oligoflexia bacterium]